MSDEDVAMKGIEAMEAFYHRIGMPVNMGVEDVVAIYLMAKG